jgi:hypothetical protein
MKYPNATEISRFSIPTYLLVKFPSSDRPTIPAILGVMGHRRTATNQTYYSLDDFSP